MREYIHKFVPGPTSIPEYLFDTAYCLDLGSPDIEDEFFEDYASCVSLLKKVLMTKNDVIIMSGEGMVALWGTMKSLVKRGDSVLSVCNGLYGDGFADMAEEMGAAVSKVQSASYEEPVDVKACVATIIEERPNLVTMVHCETPSGFLNELKDIGAACKMVGALFYVDFVSSAVGCELNVDEYNIDVGLLGTQKALSLKADLSVVTISKNAWKKAEEVSYSGYDAILPFQFAVERKYFPYTHNWHSVLALKLRCEELLAEGLENVWKRHRECKSLCIAWAKKMNLELYPPEEFSSPTVTALKVPRGIKWKDLSAELKANGIGVGGSYGELSGLVFRIGHMGSQAHVEKLSKALDIMTVVIEGLRKKIAPTTYDELL